MNEFSIFAVTGRKHTDLTVMIGDRFQSVSIEKLADRFVIAKRLREWADNIEHDEGMGSPPKDEQARCKDCSSWKSGMHLTGCRLYAQRDRAPQWGDLACEDYEPKVKRASE